MRICNILRIVLAAILLINSGLVTSQTQPSRNLNKTLSECAANCLLAAGGRVCPNTLLLEFDARSYPCICGGRLAPIAMECLVQNRCPDNAQFSDKMVQWCSAGPPANNSASATPTPTAKLPFALNPKQTDPVLFYTGTASSHTKSTSYAIVFSVLLAEVFSLVYL
jgi:hypothetical protein